MSRWIWHEWQSPEVKKAQNRWLDLLPPDWASRVSSNIFPFELFTSKKWNWLQLSSNLPQSSRPAQVADWGSAGHGHCEQNTSLPMICLTFLSFFFYSPASSSFLSLSFLPLSLFLPFPFLSHLSLPILRDWYSTSVLLRTKEPAAFLLK